MITSARGRPRVQEAADDLVAGVLVAAGARVGSSDYSTRRIAERTGLSQTLVSRAVRRIRRAGTPEAAAASAAASPVDAGSAWSGGSARSVGLGSAMLQLAEFRVEYPVITLRFEAAEGDQQARPRVFARRAAAVMAALWVSGAAEWSALDEPAARVSSAATDANTGETSRQDREPDAVSTHSVSAQWSPGRGDWSDFLAEVAGLLDRCHPGLDSLPGDLLNHLALRAGQGLHGLTWRRERSGGRPGDLFDSNPLALAEYPGPGSTAAQRRASGRAPSATEQIAVTLRKEMINSGFRAGDRLSVSLLAQRLGLGQARVRNAMRQLADDRLLAHSDGGFRIPHVTGTDVIDLYASRLHVGMVIVRACATQPRHRLVSARLALGTLEAVAVQGSHADAGEADLRFQQELAEASGLRQSAHVFHGLTLRLRMFISVLQLDYSPAVERLVADNRRVLAAVLDGRAGEAVRIWRSKLDDAVRHMSALAPDTFDPRLWSRLTP